MNNDIDIDIVKEIEEFCIEPMYLDFRLLPDYIKKLFYKHSKNAMKKKEYDSYDLVPTIIRYYVFVGSINAVLYEGYADDTKQDKGYPLIVVYSEKEKKNIYEIYVNDNGLYTITQKSNKLGLDREMIYNHAQFSCI